MITKGMYSAAQGMMGLIEQNDVIANNIANVNTAGYKKSSIVFRNLYNSMVEQKTPGQNPKYQDVQQVGEISMGSAVQQLVHDFSQGNLVKTGNPLDIAIQGDGFFKTRSSAGEVSYTRNGTFFINSRNQIIDENGNNLLDAENQPVVINIGDLQMRSIQDVRITEKGQVEINHEQNKVVMQTVGVFDFQDKENMEWLGHSKFRPLDPVGNKELKSQKFSIQQGSVETSNTSLVNELIGMINVSRGYETLSKFLKEGSSLVSKAIDVGRAKF